MRDMTVDEPFPRPTRLPDHIVALPWAHIDRISEITGTLGEYRAIHRHDLKGTTMHVHWMDKVVVRTDEPQLDGLPDPHADGFGRRVSFAVDREIVGQPAFHEHGRIGQPFAFEPFLQLDRILDICSE